MLWREIDTRKTEIVVGLAFTVVAAIVIRESILIGAGWGPSGPQPGFFPSLSALVMGVGGLLLAIQALRSGSRKALFESTDEAVAVLKVGAPMVAAFVSIEYIGIYVMTFLYMAFFSAWYGRYRWYVVLLASVLLPVALFFAFERGFRISLPKSVWYGSMTPF